MQIVIIGNGISGITAARFIRKQSNYTIYVVSSETDHFFSRTALMYIYMGHMKYEHTKPYSDDFWEKNRIKLLKATVQKIAIKDKHIQFVENLPPLAFDQLIIASGSVTSKYDWPGQDLNGVCGLYSLQDLQYLEQYSKNLKRAVIVGGGLIGIELAEMLHSREIPATMLVREKEYWQNVLPLEEASMISEHIRSHGIHLKLETTLQSIEGNQHGTVTGVTTRNGESISCGFVGVTTGVKPNIDWLQEQGIQTDRGVLVDEYCKTNVPGIYAIGDCAQFRNPPAGRKSIEPIWYTGRMMGETVAANICNNPTAYNPGIWFNSAKFFDIEYQVYGFVPNEMESDTDAIFWMHSDKRKSIRIVFDKAKKSVRGFNLLGIRFRQEACEQWIQAGAHIEHVLQHLPVANFDPEFAGSYEQNLITIYNQRFGTNLILKQKRGLSRFINYFKNGSDA